MPTETITPNVGLQVAAFDQGNWQIPTNYNWNLLDLLLSGNIALPALVITGDVTIGGVIHAGSGLIPIGVVMIPYSVSPIFDATQGLEFKIILTGDVSSSTFVNGTKGPSIIVFRIVQDSVGNHTFAWPINLRNGGVISSDANSRSMQMFAIDSDGSADAVGPIMYS